MSIKIASNIDFGYNPKQKRKCKQNMLLGVSGIGVAGMIIVGTGLACKGNFNKSIAKKGLEFKNNILINKNTGEKFTGDIKSNIGKIGFNHVETQSFVDGIITEKTYKNILGKELSGTFYKDGKECLNVQIGYPYFVPYNKSVAVYRHTQDNSATQHMDKRGFSGKSVFEWARNFVKEHGWLKISKD